MTARRNVRMHRGANTVGTADCGLVRVIVAGLCVATALWVGGCQSAGGPSVRIDPEVGLRRHTIGYSVGGRPLDIVAMGDGVDTTFVLAGIHGDEPAGPPLAEALIEHLSRRPYLLRGKTVVVMPLANPDGLERRSRFNANGVDLNRNFATSNRTATAAHGPAGLSEPESRAIAWVMDHFQPDRVVSIHQPLACIDYDGPGASLAYQMATLCGLPVKKLGARPGSLGSYVGLNLDRPIITMELPRSADGLDGARLWDRYGPALLTAVTYRVQAK